MSILDDFRTLVLSSTAVVATVSNRVFWNVAPEEYPRPYVWYRRSSSEEELCLDGSGGLRQTTLDVECWANEDATGTAETLAGRLKDLLHGHRGAMGGARAQAIYVDDQDDDYIPKGNMADEGADLVALRIRIFHNTT